jgi:NADPH2:quinone reductase
MKACVVQELSGPSGLVYTDVDDITGNDDTIVVDVRATGVCFPDVLLSKGEYQLKLPPPFIPGMEAAGVVHWAPEDSEFKVGDRVSAFGVLGGYAEQVIAPLANVTRSPAELDDAEAVSLLVNYNTMYFALARRAAMRAGDSVLVLGSAGGVGTAAIQVARAIGASKVIALVHRTSAMDFVGMDRPSKRSSIPPSGLLGSPTRTKFTSLDGTPLAASCDISSEEMVELCE